MTLAAGNRDLGAGSQTEPAPCPLNRIALVVNEAAGTASSTDVSELEARIRQTFPDTEINVASVAPQDLDAAFDDAFAQDPDVVVVFGGDGTARAAAKRALTSQVPIAPLPGGTMNVLPRLVFGHADLAQAIQDLPTCRVTGLDTGLVGGEPFFLSAAFGFAGPLARFRESMRPPRRFGAAVSAAFTCMRALGPSLRGGIKWRRAGAKWHRAQTLVVALGSMERVLTPEDQEMHTGERLQAAALRLKSFWEVAKLGGDAVRLRDWRELNQLTLVSAQRVELELRSNRALAVLDGEPIRLSHATEITVNEGALPVLAVRPDA
jgi:diacylglycerol kinase family enzyme